MTAAVLHVRRAGPLVTIQDRGRPRLMRYGVPASGPMDPFAHEAANAALGRPLDSTAIEISLGGLSVTCREAPVTVAVCGGSFAVAHRGEACGPWVVRTLAPGDDLTIAPGPWGSWCYLAVCGDLVSRQWMGSSATHVRSGLGGGLLGDGDTIVVDHPSVDPARDGPIDVPPTARPPSTLRVVLGPQLGCLAPDAPATLLEHTYTYTAAYDRMGVRLAGPPLALNDSLAVPSSPIVRGSIQVAGDGIPTLLFADHQTTGGYPIIATVVTADVTRAAQHRSGDTVRFVAVDPADAVASARQAAGERERRLAVIAQRPGLHTRRLLSSNLVGGVFHHQLPPTGPPVHD